VRKLFSDGKTVGFWLATIWIGFIVFLGIFGPWLPGPSWDEPNYDKLGSAPFTNGTFLGVTQDGYDIWAGLVNGARMSLIIAITSIFIGGLIGSVLGIFSAYFRGKFDTVMNAIFNIVLSIPNLILTLAFVAVFAFESPETQPSRTREVAVLIVSLAVVITPILGRIARATALQWGSREFVTAAKSMGGTSIHIIWRHIVPNVASSILSIAFLGIGVVIIAEGSLSILGVGITDGGSWGSMISMGRNNLSLSPYEVYLPVLFVALTVISCNFFGDYIRKSLDKRESKI